MDTTIPSLPEGEIKLRDGRRLAYAEFGDPQGKPIFFFHGTPGSRLFHHPDNSIAASAGARIIAIDRPGFGRSDFKPGRTLLDWPDDVVQLADALNIQRFAVMGYSGGGPYAAVCASCLPDRLTAAGLVSSIAPLDTPEITKGMRGMGHMFFSLERHLPPLARLGCHLMCSTWRSHPDLYFKAQVNGLRNPNEAQTLLPTMKAMLTADFLEAVRAGTRGITWDLEILAKPWGFQLHVIPADVLLWHGEGDTQAPLAMGKRLAAAIPHCRATFFPGEGHWAIHSHWLEILTALAEAEATIRVEPQPIAMAAQDANSGAPMVVVAAGPDAEDTPIDSVQGLQPARETPEITEPEPAHETPKPGSKTTAKRRTAAKANMPAAVSAKPEPVQETPKPGSKKTTKTPVAAIAHTRAVVPAEPKPAQEAPKALSKKANGRRAAAARASQGKASGKLKPAPEKAKAAAGNTTKHEPDPAEVKAAAKRSAKRVAVIVKPPPEVVPEESSAAPETVSARSSSRRRTAKEAVLV